KKLPPPSTKATWVPAWATCTISPAISPMRWGSTPKACEPASASPESLSKTRWKAVGMRGGWSRGLCQSFVAHLEPAGAAHLDILAEFGHLAGDQLGNRHLVVLDEVLLQQAMVFEELAQLALGDLVQNGRGLVGVGGLGLAAQIARAGGGDMHGQIVHEALKLVGAGDEITLAGNFDQHAQLASGVDVG